ncbi:hypothetical protein [Catenulispora pinisilvae]|nr:hypothetical protein [Catenulispora pinisilvae]
MVLARAFGISPREVRYLTINERAAMWVLLDEIAEASEHGR